MGQSVSLMDQQDGFAGHETEYKGGTSRATSLAVSKYGFYVQPGFGTIRALIKAHMVQPMVKVNFGLILLDEPTQANIIRVGNNDKGALAYVGYYYPSNQTFSTRD